MKKPLRYYLDMDPVRPPWHGYPKIRMRLEKPAQLGNVEPWVVGSGFVYSEKHKMASCTSVGCITVGQNIDSRFKLGYYQQNQKCPPTFVMIEWEREYLVKPCSWDVYRTHILVFPIVLSKNAEECSCSIIGEPRAFVATIRESMQDYAYIGCEEAKADPESIREAVREFRDSMETYGIRVKNRYEDEVVRKVMRQVLYECAGIGADAATTLSHSKNY